MAIKEYTKKKGENTVSHYNVKVVIYNPADKNEERTFELMFRFTYLGRFSRDFMCRVKGKDFYDHIIDLRYDLSFNPNEKEKWIEDWVKNYWNGKNGAYQLKAFEIIKED
jgi:hypothetical protein